MRQSEIAQRCVFEELQAASQGLPEGTSACNDVVVRSEDDGAFNKSHRQSLEQMPQVAGGVNAYVRSQPIAPGARQVINEQLVPEAILAVPIDAVGLERVAPVRAEQCNAAMRLQHPYHFLNGRTVILDMLDDLVAQDQVEALRVEREIFAGCIDDGG